MRKIENLIYHWAAASSPDVDVNTIRGWHVKGNKWRDIGYHRVILHPSHSRFAKNPAELWSDLVKQGRPLDDDLYLEANEKGAHALGYNHNSVGICVVAGPNLPVTDLQIEAIRETALILSQRFQVKTKNIICHRDVNATQCPGLDIYRVIKELKAMV